MIILAAGTSSRMKEYSPKCLKRIGDEEIINRIIRQFYRGADEIAVSVGFQEDKIRNAVKYDVKYVRNNNFLNDKNIESCYRCLRSLKSEKSSGVLIIEGDVILTDHDASSIISRIEAYSEKSVVFAQSYCESNKTRRGCITEEGVCYLLEGINLGNTDNRMSGIFYVSSNYLDALKKDQIEMLSDAKENYYFSPVIASLTLPSSCSDRNVHIHSLHIICS